MLAIALYQQELVIGLIVNVAMKFSIPNSVGAGQDTKIIWMLTDLHSLPLRNQN